MVVGIEVASYFAFRVIFGDFQKVLREAFFQFSLGLPNILYAASPTCNTIDKVRAAAAHVVSTHVGSS